MVFKVVLGVECFIGCFWVAFKVFWGVIKVILGCF